jgi:hypothetical protein
VGAVTKSIDDLRAENCEIKGMLGSVLTLLGKTIDKSDTTTSDRDGVIDLPAFIKKRRTDAAA